MKSLYKKLSGNPTVLKLYGEIIKDDFGMGVSEKIPHLNDDGRAH